ncbi:uncharacterized protein LOC119512902 isoform X2 [Choloepus didactylus]|uniref:uncharacterized protein LOC119512902 isoform X2 n=1 Tax=Choloepus didactylus TaxID=27675 RepID=UPI00189C736A|nr:uncharacterized protein LOC119512902 isoform X2 [Choloepus didactylus]
MVSRCVYVPDQAECTLKHVQFILIKLHRNLKEETWVPAGWAEEPLLQLTLPHQGWLLLQELCWPLASGDSTRQDLCHQPKTMSSWGSAGPLCLRGRGRLDAGIEAPGSSQKPGEPGRERRGHRHVTGKPRSPRVASSESPQPRGSRPSGLRDQAPARSCQLLSLKPAGVRGCWLAGAGEDPEASGEGAATPRNQR